MSVAVVMVGTALAIGLARVRLKREQANRIWTIGRKHPLDREEFEFSFSVGFDDEDLARSFQEMLSNQTVRTCVSQCPNPAMWSVSGTATVVADADWYNSVLAEWRRCLDAIGRPDETIIAAAGKPDSAVGMFLSTQV